MLITDVTLPYGFMREEGLDGLNNALKYLRTLPPDEKVEAMVVNRRPRNFGGEKILLQSVSPDGPAGWLTAGEIIDKMLEIKKDFE